MLFLHSFDSADVGISRRSYIQELSGSAKRGTLFATKLSESIDAGYSLLHSSVTSKEVSGYLVPKSMDSSDEEKSALK